MGDSALGRQEIGDNPYNALKEDMEQQKGGLVPIGTVPQYRPEDLEISPKKGEELYKGYMDKKRKYLQSIEKKEDSEEENFRGKDGEYQIDRSAFEKRIPLGAFKKNVKKHDEAPTNHFSEGWDGF